MRSPGPGHSTRSAPGCSGIMPSRSASQPNFTIHDQGRFGRSHEPLPASSSAITQSDEPLSRPRGPASPSTPAPSMPRCRSRRCCRGISPGAPPGMAPLRPLFAAYVEAKQAQGVLDYDDLLLYWAQVMVTDPALAADIGGRFDHVLVDEYQDTNRLQSSILLALKPARRRPDRGRRRRPVDLRLPRGDGPQHPRFPEPVQPAGRHRHAWTATTARPSPILAAANGVIEPRQPSASPRTLWTERPVGRAVRLWSAVRDEADQARYVVDTRAGDIARPAFRPEAAGRALSHLAAIAVRSRSS